MWVDGLNSQVCQLEKDRHELVGRVCEQRRTRIVVGSPTLRQKRVEKYICAELEVT